jgi:hypothetical protein
MVRLQDRGWERERWSKSGRQYVGREREKGGLNWAIISMHLEVMENLSLLESQWDHICSQYTSVVVPFNGVGYGV